MDAALKFARSAFCLAAHGRAIPIATWWHCVWSLAPPQKSGELRTRSHLFDAESRHKGIHRPEASDILVGGGGPGARGDRREAGEGHAIEQPSVVELLAPKASLHTQQSGLYFLWPAAPRIVGVAALQREGASRASPG